MTLVNSRSIIRQAAIVRLKESVTYAQFSTALSQQGAPALAAMTIPAGGPSVVDQGLSAEVILNLVPGQYATIDPFIGVDGAPHYTHGALSPFTVTTPTTTLPEPQADGEIVLKDFLYMLGSIKAGSSVIKVTNAGAQDHELMLGQLLGNKTIDDVKTYLQQKKSIPRPMRMWVGCLRWRWGQRAG